MKSLLIISSLLFVLNAYAQTAQRIDTTTGFGLIFDQDFFTPQNQDRNYTMGVSISVNGPLYDKNFLVVPWLRKGADRLFGIKKWHNDGEKFLTGMQLVDGAFTPLNIESTVPVTNDRPYGNILGLASSRTTINEEGDLGENSSITSRLVVGIIGTRVGEAVQTYIHKTFFEGKRAVPLGWPTQISDGGEPTLLYQLQYMKPIFEQRDSKNETIKRIQATWLLETNLGYFTNMASGFSFRIGRFTTPFWKFSNSGMSAISQAPAKKDIKTQFMFFVQFRGRAVVYNALLTGQFKKNEYELQSKQVNRFLLEAESGMLLSIKRLTIIYQPYILRTSETALPLARNHSWGSLAVYYNW
ncbi:MAG: lipid A deacylase LpxR family protein [Chitinophagaceae bacterium]|jgi:hypothetical protein|nr:lipid A deacylase LpxR family protein [Chitinophagaceae bacterium]